MATKSMTKTTTETKVEKPVETKVEKKTYDPEDLILCKSLVSGGLYIEGDRSKFLYTWADYGDVAAIEYRDLIYMIRSNNKNIFEPRIVIEDEDIVAEFKQLKTLYESLYTAGELKSLIDLPVGEMKKQIESLPTSVKNVFKNLVADLIDRKALDSVTKIKAIDEIFGTSFLLTLAEN